MPVLLCLVFFSILPPIKINDVLFQYILQATPHCCLSDIYKVVCFILSHPDEYFVATLGLCISLFKWSGKFYVHGSVHLITICISVQIDVAIYRFILEIQKLYMFRAFLAHSQE
jgi:hypothetical protein